MFIFSRKKLLWRVQQLLRWQWKSTDQLRYDVARVNDFLRLKSATADHFFKADIKSFFECQRVCDLGAINLSHWGRRKLGSKMCWESSLFFSLFLMRGLSGRRKIEKANEHGYRFWKNDTNLQKNGTSINLVKTRHCQFDFFT